MSQIGKELVEGMSGFLDKLKSGEEIEVTTIRRVKTPDGLVFVREKRTLDDAIQEQNGLNQ